MSKFITRRSVFLSLSLFIVPIFLSFTIGTKISSAQINSLPRQGFDSIQLKNKNGSIAYLDKKSLFSFQTNVFNLLFDHQTNDADEKTFIANESEIQACLLAPHIFPDTPVNSSTLKPAVFGNYTPPFTVFNTSITGPDAADFAMVSNECINSSAPTCAVTIRFSPTTAGAKNASFNFNDGCVMPLVGNATGGDYTISLSVGDTTLNPAIPGNNLTPRMRAGETLLTVTIKNSDGTPAVDTPYTLDLKELPNSGGHRHFEESGSWILLALWSIQVKPQNGTTFRNAYQYEGRTGTDGKDKLILKAGEISYDFKIKAIGKGSAEGIESSETTIKIGLEDGFLEALTQDSFFTFSIGSHPGDGYYGLPILNKTLEQMLDNVLLSNDANIERCFTTLV